MTNEQKRDITTYVNQIATILNINTPRVVYENPGMLTKSMPMTCAPTENTIYIQPEETATLRIIVGIAHEMRHLWQYQTNAACLADSEYETRETLTSEEYNKQAAEVDANAFAYVMIKKVLGLKLTFTAYSDEVIGLIHERAAEIEAELLSKQ